jgi:hypothetical protein
MHTSKGTFAHFLLKAHNELSRLLGSTGTVSFPFTAEFTTGPEHQLRGYSVGVSSNGNLVLTFKKNGHTYRIGRFKANPPTAELTLTDPEGNVETQLLSGEELISKAFAAPYASLHSAAMEYVQKTFGDEFFKSASRNEPTDNERATEAEASEDTEYKQYRISCENGPDVKFRGKLRAGVSSPVRNGRHHVYSVFETPAGTLICLKEGISYWMSERTLSEFKVIEKLEDVVPFFGFSNLAKALYRQMGITERAETTID